MATKTFIISLGGQFGDGRFAYSVPPRLSNDVVGSTATAVTDAATARTAAALADVDATAGTSDGAALVAYAGTVGLTGSLVASVTLTASQGNSLFNAITLANTDLTTIKTDTVATLAAVNTVTTDLAAVSAGGTGGDVVAIVNTSSITSIGKLRGAFNGIIGAAKGAGIKE